MIMRTYRLVLTFWSVAAVMLLGMAAAQAHHSFAMFDKDHQIRLTGSVQKFQWTNPHVYIVMNAKNKQGVTTAYTIECANTQRLKRLGWTFNMLKPGDTITAIVAPLRNGDPGGLLTELTLTDGRKLGNGAYAGEAKLPEAEN